MAEKATIARPYAEALFDLADQSKTLDKWSDMLSLMKAVLEDARLVRLVDNPTLSRDQKSKILLDIIGDNVTEEAANLLKLLVENKRLPIISDIVEQFELLKSSRQGSIDVTITSAYAINKTQEKKLASVLKERLGKEVNIQTKKDANLLGGVKIRAGDLVIDGSIRNKLSRLATEFGI